MSDFVLQLKNINKYFGKNHVIKNVNLNFEKGHFITFLGPSGCGKTTLLRMIAGFYEPDEGEILLNGKNIERVPPYDRNTAMVFQEYALFPHMNVFDNVSYGLRVKKKPKDEIEKRVKQALSLMQLEGMEKRFPNQMSGGQQQRVAVARALVMNPEVLLLDEPLSNLDAKLRESVRVELRQIQQKMGLSTIYVTHDQSEALSMSDAIVVLKDGIVHQVGTPQEIYFEPKTAFVADFIGTTNLISLKAESGNRVTYGGVSFASSNPVKEGVEYVASVRPESAGLSKDPVENQVNLKARITNTMFLGEKVRYFLQDALDKEWIVDAFDPGRTIHQGEVYVTFPAEKAWVIEK
jgi:ABC-type Fe3+/spermidine/putrescine transport system ATPase subunit